MQDSLSRNCNYFDRIYRVSIVMYCLSNIKLIRICCAPRSQVLCFNTNQTQVYSAVSPPGGFERKSSVCMISGSDHGSVDFHTHGHVGPNTKIRWSDGPCVCAGFPWGTRTHLLFQTDPPSPKKAPDSSAARISHPQGSCHSPAERLAFDHDLFVGSGHDSKQQGKKGQNSERQCLKLFQLTLALKGEWCVRHFPLDLISTGFKGTTDRKYLSIHCL